MKAPIRIARKPAISSSNRRADRDCTAVKPTATTAAIVAPTGSDADLVQDQHGITSWLSQHVDHEALTVVFEKGWSSPARIGFRGKIYEMAQGQEIRFNLAEGKRHKR